MQPINYDALKNAESATTQAKANQYLADPHTAPKATRHGIAKLIGWVILGFILLALLPGALKILVVILGACGIYFYTAKYSKKHAEALQKFVSDNNWQLTPPTAITVPSLTPSGESAGITSDVISGPLGAAPFMLYTYESDSGGHKKASEVVTLQLSGSLPTITLDALANNALGSNLLNRPSDRGLVEIDLEGDFQKSFKVYMEPNQQINALEIITPDIMQKMVDEGAFFDIDITGSSAHIISAASLISYPYIQKQLDFGQLLATSLESKLRTFNASTPAPVNQQTVQESPTPT